MGFPAQLDTHESVHPTHDTMQHVLLQEWQWLLRAVVAVSLIATVTMMVTIFYWAFIPAIVLLVSYLLLMVVTGLERRAKQIAETTGFVEAPLDHAASVQPERDERGRRVLPFWITRREAAIGWEIIAGTAVSAVILALFLLPLEWVLLGSFVIFAYSLFVLAPVWLGWITTETDREEDAIRDEMNDAPPIP